jgi:hypothetical protein
MRLTRETKFFAWVGAAIGVAVIAFFTGGQLKPKEQPHYTFDLSAPAYQADLGSIAATSQGGFTGFADLTSGSERTVLGGRVIEFSSTSLILETPSGVQISLRLGDGSRLSRLEPGSRDLLRAGVPVIVRLGDQPDQAAAVLVLAAP